MKFALIALIAATNAISLRTDPFYGVIGSLHNCENGTGQRVHVAGGGGPGSIANTAADAGVATCTDGSGDVVPPALVQLAGPVVYPVGLEHCPDLPERQTLRDGQTKPIVWPAKGANCIADIHPGKEGAPAPYH